jgi:hypothetical protein
LAAAGRGSDDDRNAVFGAPTSAAPVTPATARPIRRDDVSLLMGADSSLEDAGSIVALS